MALAFAALFISVSCSKESYSSIVGIWEASLAGTPDPQNPDELIVEGYCRLLFGTLRFQYEYKTNHLNGSGEVYGLVTNQCINYNYPNVGISINVGGTKEDPEYATSNGILSEDGKTMYFESLDFGHGAIFRGLTFTH